jgi:hypothetical protein
MDPTEEAAAILIRLFEAICRLNRKTLNTRSRDDIRRACELLSSAGDELDDLLDELPPPRPPEHRAARDYTTMPIEVEQWRKERR